MILYKYLPPEGVNVLQNRLIAFTPPLFSNDPFEAEVVFPSDAPEAIALFEESRHTRSQFSREEEAALQASIDKLQDDHGRRRIEWEHAVNNVGVLSLTEKKDCPLMWVMVAPASQQR